MALFLFIIIIIVILESLLCRESSGAFLRAPCPLVVMGGGSFEALLISHGLCGNKGQ